MQFIRQYIIDRKSLYIGKPLDSLLKDLPSVVRYQNGPSSRDINICPNTVLSFLNYTQTQEKLSKKQGLFIVVIAWATPLDFRVIHAASLNEWGGNWSQSAYNYFKTKIIGDITTYQNNIQ